MTRVSRHCLFLFVAVLLLSSAHAGDSRAQAELGYWQLMSLDRTVHRAPTVALMPLDDEPGQKMIYGDRYGYIRAVLVTGDDAVEIWRSRVLEGPVLEVFVEDLEGNGGAEIVARTVGGRLYVFDAQFNQRWENSREDYNRIDAMAIANMDEDPAYELVLYADDRIDYIDGQDYSRQYRSTQSYRMRANILAEIAVGNVDSDAPLEIVLNAGFVIDAVQGEADWETEAFGAFIDLLDIDGDGLQEILGHTRGQPLRVFDADEQQEKPLQ